MFYPFSKKIIHIFYNNVINVWMHGCMDKWRGCIICDTPLRRSETFCKTAREIIQMISVRKVIVHLCYSYFVIQLFAVLVFVVKEILHEKQKPFHLTY